MKIMVKCPKCNHSWLYDRQAADRRITCPDCKNLFKIPPLKPPGQLEFKKIDRGSVYVDENGNYFA